MYQRNRFEEFLRRHNLSETTINNYASRIDTFYNTYDILSSENIHAQVEDMASSEIDYNLWMCAIKKYAAFKNIDLPKITMKKIPLRLPKPLSKEEINKIYAAIPKKSLQLRCIIEFLYCGLRNQEVCSLNIADVKNKNIRVIGKGNKERLVPLNNSAWNSYLRLIYSRYYSDVDLRSSEEHLQQIRRGIDTNLINEDSPVFITGSNIRMYPRKIRKLVTNLANSSGLKGVHPHRFRHSFATHVLESGLTNLFALKEIMGHENLSTTQQYVGISENTRDQVRIFHPRHIEM